MCFIHAGGTVIKRELKGESSVFGGLGNLLDGD